MNNSISSVFAFLFTDICILFPNTFMCCPFLTYVYVMKRLLLGAALAPFWGDIIEYDLIGSLFLLIWKFASLRTEF